MEDDKKRRRLEPPLPDFDLAGPAAWGDEAPDAARRRPGKKPRPAAETAYQQRANAPAEAPAKEPGRPRSKAPVEAAKPSPRPPQAGVLGEASARPQTKVPLEPARGASRPQARPMAESTKAPVWTSVRTQAGQEEPAAQSPARPQARVPVKVAARGDNGEGARARLRKKSGKETRPPKVKKKRGLFTRFVVWALWTGLGLGVAGLVIGIIGYSYISQDLPSTEGLKNYTPPTVTYIYSDDGRVVGEYYNERRFVVPLEQISPNAINAFLAVEDADFYKHKGINPKAIIRAALANLQSDSIAQGGSTVTQQVVKTFLLTSERSYIRKAKEMILAIRIEGNLSKEEILYLYMNQIYLGRGAYGVEAAARTYFGKSAKELSIVEAAQLAGIIRSPNKNPINDPKHARDRRITALQRMADTGFITEEQYQDLKDDELQLLKEWPNPNTTITPYYTEHVRRMLEERFGADSLYNDGWKVYTAVNIESQHAADVAVARGLWEYARRRGYKGAVEELADDVQINDFLAKMDKELDGEDLADNRLYQAVIMDVDKKNVSISVRIGSQTGNIIKKDLDWALKKGDIAKLFKRGEVVWVRLLPVEAPKEVSGEQVHAASGSLLGSVPLHLSLEQRTDVQPALFSMDLENGDVKAMVGGRDFNESQFNRAVQSQRQPGSSFKPILYASAMDHGFTPGSIMNDAPFVVDDAGSGKRWKPVNSDLKFKGPMTIFAALVGSRNLISVKLLDRIGFEALAQTAQDLGITEKLPESLTVALGAHGIRMPEMVSAYSAFANNGMRVEPRYITRIEDRNGKLVELIEPKRIPSLDPGTACAVTWMLKGVVEQGTGASVRSLGRPVGGKTGTTNDYSDAWFIGFTPELATAVWLGTDEQRPRAVGEVGGKAAGPIFLYYMREALKDSPKTDFVVPPEAELSGGVCYKAGTVGTGISEAITASSPEDDFLREDFEDMEGEILGADPSLGIPEEDEERGGFLGIFGGSSRRDNSQPPPVRQPPAAPVPTPVVSQPPPQPIAAPAPTPLPPPETLPVTSGRDNEGDRGSSGRLAPYGEGGQPRGSGRLGTYGEN